MRLFRTPCEARVLYSGQVHDRLTARAGRRGFAFLALGLSVMLGGCSYRLGAFFEKTPEAKADTTDITGSIMNAHADANRIPEADLPYAQAAAIEVVTKGEKNISLSWENPRSGARGTVTPLARASQTESATCQDFLASYVAEKTEAWWEGQACKMSNGRWEVRSMTPWKRG